MQNFGIKQEKLAQCGKISSIGQQGYISIGLTYRNDLASIAFCHLANKSTYV